LRKNHQAQGLSIDKYNGESSYYIVGLANCCLAKKGRNGMGRERGKIPGEGRSIKMSFALRNLSKIGGQGLLA